MFLLFRDYFPSAKWKSYRFLASDRIASELYFFGHFDHDSYLWRHQTKLQMHRLKTSYMDSPKTGSFYLVLEFKSDVLVQKSMLVWYVSFKKTTRRSGNLPDVQILLHGFNRKCSGESDHFFSRMNHFIIQNVDVPFLFCLSYQ